jgi:hypothetical protein
LKLGERIERFDSDSLTTNLKTINRLELIDKYRPIAMTQNHYESYRKMHTRSDFMTRSEQGQD